MSLSEKLEKVTSELGIGTDTLLSEIAELNRQQDQRKQVYVKDDFNIRNGKISLIPLADFHIGNRQACTQKIRSFVDLISRYDHLYTILLGDAAETATRSSVGLGMYEEDMHLREQLLYLGELLQPIAQQGKLLGVHTGNHEFRSAVLSGINPMEFLASNLNVPYLGYQGFYSLQVGDQVYHMGSTHGMGSGRTTGAKVNVSERMAQVNPMCHLYLSGHSHIRSVHDGVKYYINQDNQLQSIKQYYVICGSFLGYFGGYAEQHVLSPSSIGAVQVDLYADSHDVQVIM